VIVLSEFECEKYVGGIACIIFNQEDVISWENACYNLLRMRDYEDKQSFRIM
jgi:hypothetical protein